MTVCFIAVFFFVLDTHITHTTAGAYEVWQSLPKQNKAKQSKQNKTKHST